MTASSWTAQPEVGRRVIVTIWNLELEQCASHNVCKTLLMSVFIPEMYNFVAPFRISAL